MAISLSYPPPAILHYSLLAFLRLGEQDDQRTLAHPSLKPYRRVTLASVRSERLPPTRSRVEEKLKRSVLAIPVTTLAVPGLIWNRTFHTCQGASSTEEHLPGLDPCFHQFPQRCSLLLFLPLSYSPGMTLAFVRLLFLYQSGRSCQEPSRSPSLPSS
jgi:hypothetical protein